jgi:hypothetical protein
VNKHEFGHSLLRDLSVPKGRSRGLSGSLKGVPFLNYVERPLWANRMRSRNEWIYTRH